MTAPSRSGGPARPTFLWSPGPPATWGNSPWSGISPCTTADNIRGVTTPRPTPLSPPLQVGWAHPPAAATRPPIRRPILLPPRLPLPLPRRPPAHRHSRPPTAPPKPRPAPRPPPPPIPRQGRHPTRRLPPPLQPPPVRRL